MKKMIVAVMIAAVAAVGCGRFNAKTSAGENITAVPSTTTYSDTCLAKPVADKILGQSSHLTESSSEEKDSILKHNCTYEADTIDQATAKLGRLYYMFEQYHDSVAAKKSFAHILSENKNMPGIEMLNGIGNEAYFHSDKTNFHLVIFRKENKMLRFKINKVTSKTSLDELMKTVKMIALAI